MTGPYAGLLAWHPGVEPCGHEAEIARLRAALADTSLAYDTGFQDGVGSLAEMIARPRAALEDIQMTVEIYEELAAHIRASQDPAVRREREGAIGSLGETLASKVRAALAAAKEAK